VTILIVFETHSTTEDNEHGIATGWLPGRLSELGRQQATELGGRRGADGIAAVFSSDLARSVETVTVAFAGSAVPVLLDWRLRGGSTRPADRTRLAANAESRPQTGRQRLNPLVICPFCVGAERLSTQ
jgi:broad specificity phosphatase PhoE